MKKVYRALVVIAASLILLSGCVNNTNDTDGANDTTGTTDPTDQVDTSLSFVTAEPVSFSTQSVDISGYFNDLATAESVELVGTSNGSLFFAKRRENELGALITTELYQYSVENRSMTLVSEFPASDEFAITDVAQLQDGVYAIGYLYDGNGNYGIYHIDVDTPNRIYTGPLPIYGAGPKLTVYDNSVLFAEDWMTTENEYTFKINQMNQSNDGTVSTLITTKEDTTSEDAWYTIPSSLCTYEKHAYQMTSGGVYAYLSTNGSGSVSKVDIHNSDTDEDYIYETGGNISEIALIEGQAVGIKYVTSSDSPSGTYEIVLFDSEEELERSIEDITHNTTGLTAVMNDSFYANVSGIFDTTDTEPTIPYLFTVGENTITATNLRGDDITQTPGYAFPLSNNNFVWCDNFTMASTDDSFEIVIVTTD